MSSAIDLEEWPGEFPGRDSVIIQARMAGQYSLPRIATDLGLSISTMFTRAKKLGLESVGKAGVHIDLDKTRTGKRR